MSVGTIFAYGQSSSGKTFTMSGSAMQPGIISLSVEEIFKQMKNVSKMGLTIVCHSIFDLIGSVPHLQL